jgi:hypothetical protein
MPDPPPTREDHRDTEAQRGTTRHQLDSTVLRGSAAESGRDDGLSNIELLKISPPST